MSEQASEQVSRRVRRCNTQHTNSGGGGADEGGAAHIFARKKGVCGIAYEALCVSVWLRCSCCYFVK